MFGHLEARTVLAVNLECSVDEAIQQLVRVTDGAQPVRWLEFSSTVLLCVAVTGQLNSGAFYVLDRKRGVWLWIDFEDEAFSGYSVSDFDRLVHDYDLLSLVERPGLLRAGSGWVLEPGKPAEMTFNA